MEENKEVASVKSNEKSFIAPLALAIAIGSCLGVFYTWSHAYKSKQQFLELARVDKSLQQTIQQQEQTIVELQNTLTQLREEAHRGNDEWVLAEVQYMVQSANINLSVEHNVPVAIKLLKAADDKVKNFSKLGNSSLRKAIANSLSALNALPQFDAEGIVISLQAMSKTLETLPLVKQSTEQQSAEDAKPVDVSTSDWRERFKGSMKIIKDMVVIRRLDQPVKPLIHPEQHANLIENLQLQLSIAQFAVLQHESKLYQSSLNEVKSWITEYFQRSDEVNAVLKSLDEMLAINVSPALPSLEGLINEIQNQKASQPTPASPDLPSSGSQSEKYEVMSS